MWNSFCVFEMFHHGFFWMWFQVRFSILRRTRKERNHTKNCHLNDSDGSFFFSITAVGFFFFLRFTSSKKLYKRKSCRTQFVRRHGIVLCKCAVVAHAATYYCHPTAAYIGASHLLALIHLRICNDWKVHSQQSLSKGGAKNLTKKSCFPNCIIFSVIIDCRYWLSPLFVHSR